MRFSSPPSNRCRPSREGRAMSRIGFVLARIAIVAALLVLWEMLPRVGAVDPRLLPPLSDVIASLIDILGRPAVKYDLLTTLTEIVIAFAISVPARPMAA